MFFFKVFLVYQGRKVIKVSKVTQDHQDLVVPQVHQGCQVSKPGLGQFCYVKTFHAFLYHGIGMLIQAYLSKAFGFTLRAAAQFWAVKIIIQTACFELFPPKRHQENLQDDWVSACCLSKQHDCRICQPDVHVLFTFISYIVNHYTCTLQMAD